MWIWITCVTYISGSQIINLTIRLKHVAAPYKVTGQLITHIWCSPSIRYGPCVARSNCPDWICGRGTDPWRLVRPLPLSQSRFIPNPYREHSGKLLKHYVTKPELDNFLLLKLFCFESKDFKSSFVENVLEYSIRIIIARWALFGMAGLVVFFVLLVLSWCLWFCCAVSQPPRREYNPLRCPLRLKDGSHYSVSLSAVHNTVTLTHTYTGAQLSASHTNHICSHTLKQTCAQAQKCTHIHSTATVVGCCLLHCIPHPLSFAHSFTPLQPCMGMRCLTPTNVTSAICAAQGNTAVHDSFPFLHLEACVVVFFSLLPSIHAYENRARWVNGNSFISCF